LRALSAMAPVTRVGGAQFLAMLTAWASLASPSTCSQSQFPTNESRRRRERR
jgi:hypothetical protein